MADIERVVKVNISLRTGGVTQQSFSEMMLLMTHAHNERVTIITRADALLDAPYSLTETDPGYLAAQVAFSQQPRPAQVYVGKRNTGEAVNTALAACAAANNQWYGFAEVTHSATDAPLAAAWAEANTKLFGVTISQAEAITNATSDLATALKTNGYFRTFWHYQPVATAFPEVGSMAEAFQKPPGSEIWAFQRLRGVPVVNLNETAYNNVKAKNGNTFEAIRNFNLTQRGITAGGEWIDIIRFGDWLCEEIRTEVFNRFVAARIPYDDVGIRVVEDGMIAALERGRRRGGVALDTVDEENNIVPGYITYVPREINVSTSDKAARHLRDTGFRARLRGAILSTEIQGELSYDRLTEAA